MSSKDTGGLTLCAQPAQRNRRCPTEPGAALSSTAAPGESMAGNQKRKQVWAEIEQRCAEQASEGEEYTPLDYLEDWISSGRTALALAEEIKAKLGLVIFAGWLLKQYRYRYTNETVAQVLARARERAAHILTDETKSLADNELETKEQIAAAKLRIETRQWIAARYNRRDLGQQVGPDVHISIGSLHIDSLRARAVPELGGAAVPALPAGELPASAREL